MQNLTSTLLILVLVVLIFLGIFQGSITDSIKEKGIEIENIISGN